MREMNLNPCSLCMLEDRFSLGAAYSLYFVVKFVLLRVVAKKPSCHKCVLAQYCVFVQYVLTLIWSFAVQRYLFQCI